MKNNLILFMILFLSGCISDKTYTNLTIVNQSSSYIASFFDEDSLNVEKWIYKLINTGTLNKNIEETYPAEPYGKSYIQSLGNWKLSVKSDTSIKYLYLVNLNIIDSLKLNYIDSVTIFKKSTILLRVTYGDLKKMNWMIVYK